MGINMSSYAIVRENDGKVLTFIRPDFSPGWEPDPGFILVPDDELPENWEKIPQSVPVPENVSARQIRLWLVAHGISLVTIDSILDNIQDESQKAVAKIEWEYAPYIERNHPLVTSIGQALNLTNEQIDQGFIEASSL